LAPSGAVRSTPGGFASIHGGLAENLPLIIARSVTDPDLANLLNGGLL
jgi:hypothetical protein